MFHAHHPASPIGSVKFEPAVTIAPRPEQSGVTILWTLIATGWRWIAGASVACALAALAFGLLITPLYTAETQVLVDPMDLRVFDNGVTPRNPMSDAQIAQVESQVRVMTSDNVLRKVIVQQELDADPEFVGHGPTIWNSMKDKLRALLPSAPVGDERADPTLVALREFRKTVRAKRAERTYVVELSVTTSSPEKSVRLADALVEAYIDEQALARAEAARRASAALRARLDELKARVQAVEDRIEEFKKQNDLVAAGGRLVTDQQLTELNNQLVLAQTRTAETRTRYEQIQKLRRSGADPGAVAEAVQSATVAALRSQYGVLASREAELRATLGAKHPQVLETRAQVQDALRRINEEIGRIAAATRSEYEQARAKEEALARGLEQLKREIGIRAEVSVRLRELERDAEASRNVYQAFLVRAREVSEQERIDAANVRVISAAKPPQQKSWPPRLMLLLAAGFVLGIGVGVALLVLRAMVSGRSAGRAAR